MAWFCLCRDILHKIPILGTGKRKNSSTREKSQNSARETVFSTRAKSQNCARESVFSTRETNQRWGRNSNMGEKSAKKSGTKMGDKIDFCLRKKWKLCQKRASRPLLRFSPKKKTLYSWTLLWTANRFAEALDTMVDDSPYNVALHYILQEYRIIYPGCANYDDVFLVPPPPKNGASMKTSS